MTEYRVLSVAVLCLWFLSMVCLACNRNSDRKYETRFCKSRKEVIKGFPTLISEHSLKNPSCVTAFSSRLNTHTLVDNWWTLLDSKQTWVFCPAGYFLQGFKFTKNENGIHALEEGRCTKEVSAPSSYERCYRQDTTTSTMCDKDYFLAGLQRDSCRGWSCVRMLKCCSMPSSREFIIDSLEVAKDKIMLQSLKGLAEIASFLGYDGAKGCFGQEVGDNFVKNGTAWEAKKCEHRDNPQLKISYKDWKFTVLSHSYSKPKTVDLPPEEIDRGDFINDSPLPIMETVRNTFNISRTVKHTLKSPWKGPDGIGVEVSYYPVFNTGDLGKEFVFDITSDQGKAKTIKITSTRRQSERHRELGPYTESRWTADLYRKQTTQNYQATILIHCSVQLEGRLKTEIAQLTEYTDDLKRYTEKSGNDAVYQFGDEGKPFFVALSDEQELWDKSTLDSQVMDILVERLVDRKRYEFVLEGKFEDTHGDFIDIGFAENNMTMT
ncbi:uncharacterized protein LOC101863118 [Aplysia californica]|uniref:Uncharacterized protein LOC101863118 n=1 Tax=Aplysia californica TaxID=6500 RepID=A0ABM0JXA4_APLCA|nr:uncharacterized protein LOC101863118 [Aplysia californica]